METKMREECPDGIDVYFDEVAGSRLSVRRLSMTATAST
jgi:NADPH-dependent curcumin reductase CurA